MGYLTVCSFILNGPGFNDHFLPKVVKVFVGITLAHNSPIGYATNWATIEVMAIVGDRIEKSIFRPEPMVVRNMPITQARIVFAGTS